jgi:Spy/CpxP family protein refolding chaperone
MKHKITLAVLAAVLIMSGSYAVSATTIAAYPQTSPVAQNPKGEGAQDRDAMKLTSDQKKQLQSIHQSTRDQLMALRNDQTLSLEQRQEKARTIREATRQQVQGILTPQQQEMVKNRRQEGRGRGAGRGLRRGFGPGNRGQEALNLTTDQRSQLKAIHQSTRDQVNAIRNDSTLTQEQKAEKVRSLHQSTRQQASGILTPEQQQKIKAERRGGRRGGHGGGPRGFGGPRGRRGGLPDGPPSADKPSEKP